MSSNITTRTGKGSALTYNEMDANLNEILKIHRSGEDTVTAGGSADALTITSSAYAATSLVNNMLTSCIIASDNTTATPTLNLDGLGAKTIKNNDGTALIAGQLQTGEFHIFKYLTSDTSWRLITPVKSLLSANDLSDVSDASTARTNLGLEIGADVQAYDADLTAIGALAKTDGNFIVGNGSTWVAENGATARTSLGLVIGTDVQAYDADLTAIASLANTDGNFIVGNGSAWVAESGSTARTSLGLGTMATETATSYLRSNTSDQFTSGTLTFNDSTILGFGTSNGEASIYSNGTSLFVDMGADKDLYVRDATTSRFLFDSSSGNFHADGDVYAFSTSVGSDPKLKDNIVPIENSLEKLSKLKGYTWAWKKDGSPSAGVISTEVKEVLPEAVTVIQELSTESEFEHVNYNAIIGLLVQSVNELSVKVKELEGR